MSERNANGWDATVYLIQGAVILAIIWMLSR